MDTNKRMFRFLNYGLVKGVGIFWIIMLIINTISIGISFSTAPNFTQGPMIIDQGTISFVASNFFAIFIFFIVYNIEMYFESFSLAISFGGTRKRFYINLLISNIMMALIFATIQIILLKIEYFIMLNSVFEPIVEFGWFNIREDGIFSSIFSISFVLLALLSITNLIGALQYRFGYKFWVGLVIFVIFDQWTFNLIGRFIRRFMFYITDLDYVIPNQNIIMAGFLIILLGYGIGFLLTSKVNIK